MFMTAAGHFLGRSSWAVSCILILALCAADPVNAQGAFTTASRFNLARQLVGTIHPQAAGVYEAVRYSYGSDALLKKIERGYLLQWQSESVDPFSWSGFVIQETIYRTHDPAGRLLIEHKPSSSGTAPTLSQRSYNASGDLECVAIRMNPAAFAALPGDACTHTAAGTDGPDRITRYFYDVAGQLEIEQSGYLTNVHQSSATYGYTNNGRTDWVEDANGNRTDYSYDGFDRLNQTNFPPATLSAHVASSSDYELYGYDPNGNRTSLRLRSGESIGFQYDALNRVVLKQMGGSSPDVHYGYDLLGRALYARYGSPTGFGITHEFDAFGRMKATTTSTAADSIRLEFKTDEEGNQTRITWPDGMYVEYSYDGRNRTDQVRENGATTGLGLLADFSFDPLGRRSSIVRGNGTTTSYGFDGLSRLQSIGQDVASVDRDVTFGFSYNSADQINQRTISNDAYTQFSLPRSVAYNRTGQNRISAVGGVSYQYDARGNLTFDGTRSFAYDLENHLLSVSGSSPLAATYDPLGRLSTVISGGVTTRYVYDGSRLVAEFQNSSLKRRYVHGPTTDEPLVWYQGAGTSTKKWLHADHQNSIVSVTDTAGHASPLAYEVYGTPAHDDWSGSPFKYTGQLVLPGVKLYHYKARVYHPGIGRFLQTDPVGYSDDLNLYAYVRNDPLNHTDPTGMAADVFLDIAFIGYDVYQLVSNPSWTNAGALGADIVGAAIPFATGLGTAVRGLDKAGDVARKEGIVYERINRSDPTEKPYIGRAKSDARFAERQKEHFRRNPGKDFEFRELERAEPGRPLREAEQRQITERGGPTNKSNPDGGTSNKRNEIAPRCIPTTGSRIADC